MLLVAPPCTDDVPPVVRFRPTGAKAEPRRGRGDGPWPWVEDWALES